ncbi:unnamed protein product [Closterium sp. NIES-53]
MPLPLSLEEASVRQLRDLQICDFEELRELPETVSQLQHLTLLKVLAPKLTSIPDGIIASSRLCDLDLSRCKALQKLPSLLTQLGWLNALSLEKTSISSLPPGFAQLTRPRTLSLYHCELLEALPDDLTELKGLQYLNIKGCKQVTDGMPSALRCGLEDKHGLTIEGFQFVRNMVVNVI